MLVRNNAACYRGCQAARDYRLSVFRGSWNIGLHFVVFRGELGPTADRRPFDAARITKE